MGLGQRHQARQHFGRRRAGLARRHVHMQAHLLDGGHHLVAPRKRDEDVQPFLIRPQHLHRPGQPVAQPRLSPVQDMAFGGVIAVPARHIVHVGPDQPQQVVGGFRGAEQIAAFGHVAVVVDPARQHLQPRHHQWCGGLRRRRGQPRGQSAVLLLQHPPRPPVAVLQHPQEPHEVRIADTLQLTDRIGARLRVGLACDQVHQLVSELGHVGQLRPGPLQAGAELRHEVLHPRLAARDAVGLEQAHLAPPQAKAHADRLVDLFGRGDAVLDQPQRLAPHGFQKAVGDMGVDLLAHMQGKHADAAQGLFRRLDHRGVRRRRGHDLGQGQQVDRVEGVRHEDRGGVGRALLQFRRLEARSGRPDRHARRHLLDLRKDPVLQVQPLADRLLHIFGTLQRLGDAARHRQRALGRHRHIGECRQRGAGIGQHLADLAPRLRVGVEHRHVPAVQKEPRGPAAADHAAADQGGLPGLCHSFRLSSARAGSVRGTRTPGQITAGS